MTNKPSIPQGTRDFSAEVVRKRNYIFSVIRNVFEVYGFQPLETPAMENLETLMGKYGEEGDKLIYRVLDSGNPFNEQFLKAFGSFLHHHDAAFKAVAKAQNLTEQSPYEQPFWKIPVELLLPLFKKMLEDKEYAKYLPQFKNPMAGKALKYDLTIPFARYVAMNHTKLSFPFKRYQIQPVWRADRPQKGRYREFTQCDVDIVGSKSLLNEAELVLIYAEVFDKLGIDVEIRINNRKMLIGLAELSLMPEKFIEITAIIDKLDKIGIDKVKEHLLDIGLKEKAALMVLNFISTGRKNDLANMSNLFANSKIGQEGIREIGQVLKFLPEKIKKDKIIIDSSLARGLNYYTGCIFEVTAKKINMGSIGGGGRYDDLTGLFGVPNIPGVGISFGVDRIYDVLEEMNLFPENLQVSTKALFFNMGEAESNFAFGIMQKLRSNGIACELYHEAVKINKQFTYAEKKNIPFVIIIGSKEMEEKSCSVKNLTTGLQEVVTFEKLAEYMKKL